MHNASPLRVVIADDHQVVRRGLAQVLAPPEFEVVGQVASHGEAIDLAERTQPDAVLLDLRMEPHHDGIATIGLLKQRAPGVAVVVFTAHANPTYVARALAHGADDFLLKGESGSLVADAVRRAVAGDRPPHGSQFNNIRKTLSLRSKLHLEGKYLTQREAQVTRNLAYGLSNREIARSLGITEETVKEHLKRVMRKLGFAARVQVATWAVRNDHV